MVIMAKSSGRGHSSPHMANERRLNIPKEEYPDWAKEGHYDGVMLYDSRDADEAFVFKQIIEKFIVLENGQKASLCVLDNSDNLVWVQGRFSALEEAIKRSTFLFLFMTDHLCNEKNHYAKWLRDEALMEVLQNREKHWCLVPIHTRRKAGGETYVNPFGIRSLRGVNVGRMLRDKSLSDIDSDSIDELQRECLDRQILQNIQKTLNSKLNLRIARERRQAQEIEKWIFEESHRRTLEQRRYEHDEEMARYKQEKEKQKLSEAISKDKEEVEKHIQQNPTADMDTVDKWKAQDQFSVTLPKHIKEVVDILLNAKQSEQVIIDAVKNMHANDSMLIARVAQYIAKSRAGGSLDMLRDRRGEVNQNNPYPNQQIVIFQQVDKVNIGSESSEGRHSSDSEDTEYHVIEAEEQQGQTINKTPESSDLLAGGLAQSEGQGMPATQGTSNNGGDPVTRDVRPRNARRAAGSPVEDECLPDGTKATVAYDDEVDNGGSDTSPSSNSASMVQPFKTADTPMISSNYHSCTSQSKEFSFKAFPDSDNNLSPPCKSLSELTLEEDTGAKKRLAKEVRKMSKTAETAAVSTVPSQLCTQPEEDSDICRDYVIIPPLRSSHRGLKNVHHDLGIEMRNVRRGGNQETDKDENETNPLKIYKSKAK